jgi:hypothetical protein
MCRWAHRATNLHVEHAMPHRVDIDSIHQNSFLLLNIAYGAKEFARTHDLASDDDYPITGGYYVGWLKFTLSEKLIDTAIKTRIILDMVRAEEKQYEAGGEKYVVDSRDLDKKISSKYNIAGVVEGDAEITVRECCNKIIHALDIQPIYEGGDDDHFLDEESEAKREWKYWGGSLDLSGLKGQEEWHFELHVSDFCTALEELVSELEGSVDWQSLHYDDDAL